MGKDKNENYSHAEKINIDRKQYSVFHVQLSASWVRCEWPWQPWLSLTEHQVSDLVWHQMWINILTPVHTLTQSTPKCVLGLRPFDIWLDDIILLGDITWNRQSRIIKLFYVSQLNKALLLALDTSEDT